MNLRNLDLGVGANKECEAQRNVLFARIVIAHILDVIPEKMREHPGNAQHYPGPRNYLRQYLDVIPEKTCKQISVKKTKSFQVFIWDPVAHFNFKLFTPYPPIWVPGLGLDILHFF